MHKRTDDPFLTESRGGIITSRALPVASYHLGLTGICDVVEFTPSADGVNLPGYEGAFVPVPVEYKRGKPKQDQSDVAQLCAQAICLEEMLSVEVPVGYLYYGKTRRRVEVPFTADLRAFVRKLAQQMHQYFERGYTPRVRPSKACRSCSLKDICLPELETRPLTASEYIRKRIDDE